MTEIILNYINNILQLSIQTNNIEKEFKNGFLFGELLEKSGNLKSKLSKYNNNPKNILEIKENFKTLKKDLKLMGIYINETMINDIISEKKGTAAKLIYKIKTKIDGINLNFSNIVGKINENSYRERNELIKTKNNLNLDKIGYLETTKTNKFSISPTMTTRESTFRNFFLKPNMNQDKIILKKENKDILSDSKDKNIKSKSKIKLKPIALFDEINLKEKENIIQSSKTTSGHDFFGSIEKYKSNQDSILEKDNDDEDEKNINNIKYIFNRTNIKKKIRKNNSTSTYNKNLMIKTEVLNNGNNNIFNRNKYIKYSLLDKNTKKLGINIKGIIPLLKVGKNFNNDVYLTTNQIISSFKNKLYSKKGKKLIFGKIASDKNNRLNSNENMLKNSIINHNNKESKLFSLKFKRNSSQYKMKEYNKFIKSKIEHSNRINNRIYFLKNSNNVEQEESGIKYFDTEEYINTVNNENNENNSFEETLKNQIRLRNIYNMKNITNLIIDFAEECFKSQKKFKKELIDLPEYVEWIQYFIEGKSCLKIPVKKRKDIISNINNSINNNSSNITITKKSDNKNENKSIINDDNFIMMEYIDYLFYRGNWELTNYVDKNLFGTQLHIYKVLGDEIFNLIPSVNNLFKGVNPSILLEKTNHDFELKENEINNILIPNSNIRDTLLTEIILLNFDNIFNEYLNNNTSDIFNNVIKKLNLNNETNDNDNELSNKNNNIQKEETNSNEIEDFDFSYIPIKLCIFGHSFSGRKTQAKLLCEKYKNLKSYSINEITKFYIDEYIRLHTPLEKNPKIKNLKKNQIHQMKEKKEEDLKNYKDIFILIEKYLNIDKTKEINLNNLNIDEISDELKINLLIYEIKKDFPKKTEEEINNEIKIRSENRIKLEEELKKLKEENNNEKSINSKDKENKKTKNKSKKKDIHNIESITEELEKIINDSCEGFILYDYPNNFIQCKKLENITTGYLEEIENSPDKRDFYTNMLTNSLDKPYINISNTNNETKIHLKSENNFNKNSFFNCYILLELSEEETLKRMNNRFKDPKTDIIYHMEYSPPNLTDKKLKERLIPITEPNDDKIKDLINQFYSEYPKILYFINLFKNLHIIDIENKEEIFKNIENIVLVEIKKFEERESKDILGNLLNINCDILEENEVAKYFKRLDEIKKIVTKGLSEEIIKNWFYQQEKYNKGVLNFINNFIELKNNIIEQMKDYQEEFIDFLNIISKKYKLVDIFYKKYNSILEKYPYIKNHYLVKEEFENNVLELKDNLWEMIQMRKRDCIYELNYMKNQLYIKQQLELFGEYIINLIVLETKQYFNKINLIKKFYLEFENQKITEKIPYEFIFKKDLILENINEYPIFDSNLYESKKIILSPRINKLYYNCYKLFFNYDQAMISIKEIINENNNSRRLSRSSSITKKRLKIFRRKSKNELSIFGEIKIINSEEEMKAALSNEKIKYKIRILFLKNFAEKNLKEIYDIGKVTFNNLDEQIIESVNSQNNALNELILNIKKKINEGTYKLNVKNIELDIFDIYEKSNVNFTSFNLKALYSVPEIEKKINYENLYKIYLDIKTFEIQKNYATVNSVIDIVFKKHLFENKSDGFMKYMLKIPYNYLYTYINKFVLKQINGYSVIKLNEFFTSLALLNIAPAKKEDQLNVLKNVNNKLKYKIYLTKKDFMNCKMWFEKNEENNNNDEDEIKNLHTNERSGTFKLNQEQNNIDTYFKEKKFKSRGSFIIKNANFFKKETSQVKQEKNLKELLFDINMNEDEYIDIIDFMKRVVIKRNTRKRKTTRISNGNQIKNIVNKTDLLSQNSFFESVDKTHINDSSTNYFRASKVLTTNNSSSNTNLNLNEENKIKSLKSQKQNDNFKNISELKFNNNDTPEVTYFDYYFKKN